MNLAMIFVLFFMFVFFVTSRGNIEPFSSDEPVQNISSLYNQGNLTVTQITTPKIIGQPNITFSGNVSIPGTITSPSLDAIRANMANQINQLSQRIATVENGYVKKGPISLIANYSTDGCGLVGNNREVTISEGWFLRAHPYDVALNCKGQLSIK